MLKLQEDGKMNKEYLTIEGIPDFYEKAVALMLGEDSTPLKEGQGRGERRGAHGHLHTSQGGHASYKVCRGREACAWEPPS